MICVALVALCLFVYETTSYGGIRSPDSEIVYRAAESLVHGNGLTVQNELENWPEFGVARGRDGRLYSIFGPGQSVAIAPLVLAGEKLAHAGFFRRDDHPLPISHFVMNGLDEFASSTQPTDRDAHGKRWLATRLNVVVSALVVLFVYLLALRLSRRTADSVVVALICAFGTLIWPYAGTCFSEPMATLFVIAAFYVLTGSDPSFGAEGARLRTVALSAALLGLATMTHVTALLFAPFFLGYALYPYTQSPARRAMLPPTLSYLAGIALPLGLLAYYNWARFGSVFETGRTVDAVAAQALGYGRFTNPLPGIYGLLVGPYTGLLFFSPIIVLAAFGWRHLRRTHPFPSQMLAGALLLRIVFIASRSDWHGGVGLGPRYLLMMVPFLALPLTPLVREALQWGKAGWTSFITIAWFLIAQQLYFAVGEEFTHYDLQRMRFTGEIFADKRIFTQFAGGPLSSLHTTGYLDSFRLRILGADVASLVVIGCIVIAAIALLVIELTPEDEFRGDEFRGDAPPTP